MGLLVIGCKESPTTPLSDVQPRVTDAAQLFRAPSYREEMLALARAVPGLSGMFVDSTGVLTVRLVDVTAGTKSEYRAAVASFAEAHRVSPREASSPRFLSARATYGALDTLSQRVLFTPEFSRAIRSISVDERNGTVEVAVESAKDSSRLAERYAVEIAAQQLVVRRETSAMPGQTLRSYRRPLEASYVLNAQGVVNRTCSTGFTAFRYDYDPNQPDPSLGSFVLTASHCGVTFGSADVAAAVWQPGTSTFTAADRIGEEAFDTQTYLGTGVVPGSCVSATPSQCVCPVGVTCADADAMLVKLDAGVSMSYGWITRATTVANGVAAPGVLGYSSMSTTNYSDTPIAGTRVTKVGQRTGLTEGTVQSSCEYVWVQGTSRFPCQVRVAGRSGGGDSGGPVYMYVSGNVRPVPLGIYHSYLGDAGVGLGNTYWFAPLSRVRVATGVNFSVK